MVHSQRFFGETRGGLVALPFGSLVNYTKLSYKQRHFEHRLDRIQINQARILAVSTRIEKRSEQIA